MILPGSYANGFAPRDGRPLYPELWRGCVGAWAPCLGPTGLALRDWSGFGNHGTLTGMAAGTAWRADQKPTLNFDGTDDFVSCGSTVPQPAQLSLSFWFKPTGTITAFDALIGRATTDAWANGFGAFFQTSTTIRFYSGLYSSNFATSGAIIANDWNHVVGIHGPTLRIVLNGVEGTAGTPSFIAAAASFEIGRLASNMYNINGNMDDVRLYNRVLSSTEIKLLQSRRGIAYEIAPRHRSSVQVITGNRRRRLLIGASS